MEEKSQVQEIVAKAKNWYRESTSRERSLLGLAIGVAAFLAIYSIVEKTVHAFSKQNTEITQAEETLEQLGSFLVRYVQLQNQKQNIESRFKGAKLEVGIRSYIEDLATNKAEISSRLNIQQTSSEPFGEQFELENISVSFNSSDPAQLVKFLQELDRSEHPIILSRLDIRKSGSRLQVQTRLSSISESTSQTS